MLQAVSVVTYFDTQISAPWVRSVFRYLYFLWTQLDRKSRQINRVHLGALSLPIQNIRMLLMHVHVNMVRCGFGDRIMENRSLLMSKSSKLVCHLVVLHLMGFIQGNPAGFSLRSWWSHTQTFTVWLQVSKFLCLSSSKLISSHRFCNLKDNTFPVLLQSFPLLAVNIPCDIQTTFGPGAIFHSAHVYCFTLTPET